MSINCKNWYLPSEQRERQSDTDRETDRDRQRQRQTDRDTDRQYRDKGSARETRDGNKQTETID